MRLRYTLLGGFLALSAFGAQARGPLPVLDGKMSGPRSTVLVLGTPHLSEIKRPLAEPLQPVLDRLAAFKPDIITVENLSGEQCDLTARHPSVYPAEELSSYCVDTGPAKTATGLDVPAAIAEYTKTLRAWPAQPTAAQRRRLAAVFLAAGEHPSALVQWLQLPGDEQHAGDGLDAALVARLQKLSGSNNESYSIAARLAARLGLARVHTVDDHTGDNVQIDDEKAYGEAVTAAWSRASKQAKANRARQDALSQDDDMLALYRFANRPDVLRTAIENDFALAMADPSPQHYGRYYVGGWEARNLRMVANIRAAFRERPGARVLSIVGSSHKPWFDGLLGQMQGVTIADAQKALK
ncbi:DUF5694 domain-containing protein [Tahibacter caeni]|uniref:DUF5694 domain-containing protein n=1 Tax=Tahibacter caeni TaxID=1453545 RepID=UPI0021478F69|nr:DUF5694 domain-containing protein [Tahibacter caeni]